MSLPGFDDWLTDQDRWAGSSFSENYPTDDQIVSWNEANEYMYEEEENPLPTVACQLGMCEQCNYDPECVCECHNEQKQITT